MAACASATFSFFILARTIVTFIDLFLPSRIWALVRATNEHGSWGQPGQSWSSRRVRNRRLGTEVASLSARRYAARASSSRPRRRSSSPRMEWK